MANLVHRTRSAGTIRRSRQQERGPRTEFLAFLLGGSVYAAPVALIQHIRRLPRLTPVPRAPYATLGIVRDRGRLLTVVDLRKKLRLAEAPITPKARILFVNTAGGEMLGLLVDAVLQVYRLSDDEIEPAGTALGGEVAGAIAGIARPVTAAPRNARVPEQASGDARRLPGLSAASVAVPPDQGVDASVIVLLDLRAVLAS